MLILYLWGISFHAVVVFGLGKDLLFKSVLGHCGSLSGEIVPTGVLQVVWQNSVLSKIQPTHQFTTKMLGCRNVLECRYTNW